MKNNPIYVTKPFLPPLEEFIPYLEKIWNTKILTNKGPFHQEFETELATFLGVKYLSLFANGTIALVTALQALRISGEVITTPYSFVATAHSLLWNGIKPVFVDIDPDSLNIDSNKIEEAITPKTTAILPVHCYGNPCDVEKIQTIADNYNLKVIYDAAHAFGVKYKNNSILNHGDLSVLSFHATKVFTTFEGGGIVCPDGKTKQHIDHLKNFGFVNETTVVASGINGKMSEFSAALGLLQLKHINDAIKRRRQIDQSYRSLLENIPGVKCIDRSDKVISNYAYFPVLIESDFRLSRDDLYHKLRENNIYARRYFYPLISEFPMYRGLQSAQANNLPVANSISQKILCLPIYPDLTDERIEKIANVLKFRKRSGGGSSVEVF
jgi:dTDP-4-amino-4,6-dideoxygalactose transaminase